MSEPQLVSADPNYGLPKTSPDDLLKQARAAAAAGDVESANAAFFQIPQGERARRGLYSGPGGGDATGAGTMALAGATGIAGVARAVSGAGPTIAGRTLAGAKEAVTQLTPVVKYEATKTLLTKMGVPEPLAVAAAIGISGYRMGGKAATAETSAAEAAPVPASARGVPTSPAASTAGAARQSPTAGSPPSVPPTAGSMLTLKASETKEYMRLLKAGKTSQEARELIQAQRDLIQRLGLPTSEEARLAVKDRNTSGRWPE